MELDHHGAVHLRPVHVVDALHADQVLLVALALDVHHVLVAGVLMLSLAVVQVLVDRDVLQMVLILFLAAERELGALVQLVRVALPGYVHHDEVFPELVLVQVIHTHGVVVHLAVVL